MIWYWKTLKIDAERFKKLTDTEKERDEDGDLVWNYDSTFPMRHEDGPVPLHINHSFGSGYREACPAPQGQKGQGFLLDEDPVSHCPLGPPSSKSTFLTLDFAKLTIQMGAPMQWHHHMNGTKVRQHARRLDGGPTLTCGDLFPDLFFYTGRNRGHPEGWDASLFGCKNCDVHVLVSVSIQL